MSSSNTSLPTVSDVPCPRQDYLSLLESGTFRKLPRELLPHLVKELKGKELALYLILFDESEFNRFIGKQSTVRLSYAQMASKMGVSATTAGRALQGLKNKGWTQIFHRAGEGDNHLANDILVSVPTRLAKRLLLGVPEESSKVEQQPAVPVWTDNSLWNNQNTDEAAATLSVEPVPENTKPHPQTTTQTESKETTTEMASEDLLARYETAIESFKNQGHKILTATLKAQQSFSPSEKARLLELQTQQKKVAEQVDAQAHFYAQPTPKMTQGYPNLQGGLTKNDAEYISRDNSRDFLKLTLELEGSDADLNQKATQAKGSRDTTDVNHKKLFSKPSNQPCALTASEHNKLIKKIRWLQAQNRIKGNAAKKPLAELINEVTFHTQYCRSDKVNTFAASLKGAQTLLERGTWERPHRLCHIDSRRREKAASEAKRAELADFKKVWGNNFPVAQSQLSTQLTSY